MKTKGQCLALAAMAALPIFPSTAHAAVWVDFSGGAGAPLAFTLPPLTWQITDAVKFNTGPVFGIGIAVGQTPVSAVHAFSSIGGNTAHWSATGATGFTSGYEHNFYENNAFGGVDGGIIWYGMASNQVSANGETISFSGGTLGTSANVAGTFADGLYEVYLMDGGNAHVVSTAAVPEPSSLAVTLCAGLLFFRRRR